MSGEEAIELLAPAKVNLFLHVVGRRADGFHNLETIFAFTDLVDRVEVRQANDFSLSVDGPFAGSLPPASDNLVTKAAQRLAEKVGIRATGAVKLTKRLPVAAGLGSGSADAAAALKGLARLWGLNTELDLAEIGLTLGADVPACISSHSSFVTGIGEVVTPIELPEAGLVLVNPGIELSTASVFEARRGGFSPTTRMPHPPSDMDGLVGFLQDLENDLTPSALRLCPVIQDVLTLLEGLPGCRIARMSGSGATCFGLFDNREAAAVAAAQVNRDGWWVGATHIVRGDASHPER